MKKISLRLRLTLWYSALLAGTLLIFGVGLYLFVDWQTYAGVKDQLASQSHNIIIKGSRSNLTGWSLNVDRRSNLAQKDMHIQLVNYLQGGVQEQTDFLYEQGIVLPYDSVEQNPQQGFVHVQMNIEGQKYSMLVYQRPVKFYGSDQTVGLLQVGVFTYNEESYLSGLRTILISASLTVVLLAFTVGLIIAKTALRPIERMIRSAEQIEKGVDLSVRLPENGARDELGKLTDTLNSMLERLESAYNELDEAYRAQRRFVSDASHELRTPLTTIRGNIELLEKMWQQKLMESEAHLPSYQNQLVLDSRSLEFSREAMQDISSEAKRMSRLVNDLLALARADAGFVMEREPVAALALTEEVVRRAALLPHKAEWIVDDLSKIANLQVYANYDFLQQLLFIFIENAFKYTEEGYAKLSVLQRDSQLGWVIEDTGIGMAAEEVPHIFDRFYRADESRGVRTGTGLGLSIAKWIIDEHDGSVEVFTREGEGTKFIVWLPISFAKSTDSSIIES